ncbi:hypothetical protein M885DRAFT_615754 [Pelagophyceae sp. CCMP2097]|nr:hypothetical protein M885DRAFT_615754 [Pelagophyceae sp. CCMP2097]
MADWESAGALPLAQLRVSADEEDDGWHTSIQPLDAVPKQHEVRQLRARPQHDDRYGAEAPRQPTLLLRRAPVAAGGAPMRGGVCGLNSVAKTAEDRAQDYAAARARIFDGAAAAPPQKEKVSPEKAQPEAATLPPPPPTNWIDEAMKVAAATAAQKDAATAERTAANADRSAADDARPLENVALGPQGDGFGARRRRTADGAAVRATDARAPQEDGGRQDGGRQDGGGRNEGGRNEGGRNEGGRNEGGREGGGRPARGSRAPARSRADRNDPDYCRGAPAMAYPPAYGQVYGRTDGYNRNDYAPRNDGYYTGGYAQQQPYQPSYGGAPYGSAPYGSAQPYSGQQSFSAQQSYSAQQPYVTQQPYSAQPYATQPYTLAPYGSAPYGAAPRHALADGGAYGYDGHYEQPQQTFPPRGAPRGYAPAEYSQQYAQQHSYSSYEPRGSARGPDGRAPADYAPREAFAPRAASEPYVPRGAPRGRAPQGPPQRAPQRASPAYNDDFPSLP